MNKGLITLKTFLLICFYVFISNLHGQNIAVFDSTFGINGKILTDLNNSDDYGFSVFIQSDDKILLGGATYNGLITQSAIVRYLPNGNIDLGFGNNGFVITTIENNYNINSIICQSDAKIIAVGMCSNNGNPPKTFTVIRYQSNGQIDSLFGVNGIVQTNLGNNYDLSRKVVLQTDGRILVMGESHAATGANYNFGLVRYNPDGSLDNAFGNQGIVVTELNSDPDFPKDILLQDDGKILVTGKSSSNSTTVRYNSNGSLDNTFGVSGIVKTIFGSSSAGEVIAIQPDHKIIVAGYVLTNINNTNTVIRYNNNGSIDSTFGTNGIVITGNGYYNRTNGIHLFPDGKILLASTAHLQDWGYFSLLLYNNDGSLVTNFGYNGNKLFDFGYHFDECYGLGIQSSGNIIVAGYASNGQSYDFALARFKGDVIIGNENLNKPEFLIYPNPTTNFININLSQNYKDAQLSLLNSLGQEQYSTTFSGKEYKIDVKNMTSGIYVIRIKTGQHTEYRKVVKN